MSAGFSRASDVVAEAELLHRAAPEVLDQHVGVAHQAQQDLAALRLLEVERDAALVAVQHQERRRDAVDARLAIAARVVAAGQLLDLDDVGAESASITPQVGPAMICASSSTRMPASGPGCGTAGGASAHRPPNSGLRFARNAA